MRFWAFIARKRASGLSYIVGVDLDYDRLTKARAAYDDVILADAKRLPFRASSSDAVAATNINHAVKLDP
ncbi:MAG: hypothetical protein DRZ82_09395 [Thermoprotei archaeon]|nr:MAG: hypothetical protein DRZ82_09395 [Thermoprotei archaeon]